ncbi:MAG: glycosyl hydrolase family 28-related protein, partial [Pseudomonadota bacterium]
DGGDGNDRQAGGTGNDELTGGLGDDRMEGNDGDDTLFGGEGNDRLNGGAGADSLYGGEGDDDFFVDAEDTLIDGGDGFDEVRVTTAAAFTLNQGLSSIERVTGNEGDDVFDASSLAVAARQDGNGGNDTLIGGIGDDRQSGGAGDDTIDGGDGNDRQAGGTGNDDLSGGLGDDRIEGNDGDDTLIGGEGNDRLNGGAGADALYGGEGDDDFFVDAEDTLIDGGEGFDEVRVTTEMAFSLDQGLSSIERVTGNEGNDVFDASSLTVAARQDGNGGNDTLIGGVSDDQQGGGAGDDTIDGGDGNDRQAGGTGNDELSGGLGDDRIEGNDGDDTIIGGAGTDRLSGGEGADTFIFGTVDGSDTLNGFELGVDTIHFTDGSFEELTFSESGRGVTIGLEETSVFIDGVSGDQLSEADFSFDSPIPFPDDFGIINVADFGVIADDGIDDTAALQALFDTFATRVTYFFEDGVYDISDTLTFPNGVGTPVPNFITIQGESEDGTIFKLADNLNFQGGIFEYTPGVAQAFNNRVMDVTFDIGIGNPDAIGLSFNGNNQSAIRNVTIRSEDGGSIGLNLTTGETGPILIEDVTIEGFNIGIDNRFQGNSVTVEGLTLRGQEIGINNGFADGIFARQVDYEGPGVGLVNGNQSSRALLIDSEFTSTDPDMADPAIINTRFFYGENITTEGFNRSLENQIQGFFGNRDVNVDDIDEYFAVGSATSGRGGAFQLFDSPDTRIGLELKETPDVPLDPDFDNWANIADFGGVPGVDATAAFQAAIDSGATTVYIPPSDERWIFEGEIVVRGNVERVIGSDAGVLGRNTVFRIADGEPDVVIFEAINAFGNGGNPTVFLHDSDRTVVLQDITGGRYEAVAEGEQGDVYFENFVGPSVQLKDQNAYARQLNTEGDTEALGFEANIVNDGANFVVLGLKTEGPGTIVKTINDGVSEILGSWHNGPVDNDAPRFVTEDAHIFAAITTGATSASNFNLVEETRDGVTLTGRIAGDVYSGYDPALIADRLLIVDNDDAILTGDWQDAGAAFPGGFLGDNFLFADSGSDATISFEAIAETSGTYEVSLRDIRDTGGQAHSGHTGAIDIAFGAGDDVLVFEDFDMSDRLGPRWEQLGFVEVEAGETLFVRYSAADATDPGTVIADSVRFELVEEPIAPPPTDDDFFM